MSKRILIVEDDVESLKLIGLMLQRRGYTIVAANAGSQALTKAKTEKPDLVILDVMMPSMDGYEVCRKLRSNPDTAHLPVLMFTAKTLVGDKVAGFRAGADDYLTKPIHPSELVSHVEALLNRSARTDAETTRQPRARVIGVMGAKGGVGASTLLLNLAAAAGQPDAQGQTRRAQTQVSIVDLRVGSGTVALLLGHLPVDGWADLVKQRPERLDRETVERHIVDHPSGLRYLPASLQPDRGQAAVPPDHVEVVINHMAADAEYVFLDLGSVLDETIRRAVALCDSVVVVVGPGRLCLVLAQLLLDGLRASDGVPDDLQVVLVELTETDSSYSREDVEELLKSELADVVKPAAKVMREAAEMGIPAVLSHPKSEIARQFRDLSQALLA